MILRILTKKKSLIISLFFILKDLFYKNSFGLQYTLRNKIMATLLVNIYATRYSFINKKFVEIVYQVFEIEPQCLTKPKQI